MNRKRRSRSGRSKRSSSPRIASHGSTVDGSVAELQETVGNKAVTAILRQANPEAGKKGSLADLIDFQIPGLDAAKAKSLRDLLKQGKRQKALDLVVGTLADRGEIDRKLLQKSTMHYAPAAGGEGEALPPGYDTDAKTGKRTARPTVVRIGPAAFKDPSVLYSTVVHEYRHVTQFQSDKARGTEGQRSLDWLIERQEVEAYTAEIFQAKNSGLWWQPSEMREVWRRLHQEHWLKLGPKGRILLHDMYVRAHVLAQKAVGTQWKLPFQPKG